jgi:mono/diheme cytochrome c family protein
MKRSGFIAANAGLMISLVCLALLLASFSSMDQPAAQTMEEGQVLFKEYCVRCHGNDGTRGMFGAKNLQRSVLSDEAIIQQMLRGKGFMPSFRKKLSEKDMLSIVKYVKSLRKD